MVAFVVARELALFHFFFIASQRLQGIGLEVGVRLHELGNELVKETQ